MRDGHLKLTHALVAGGLLERIVHAPALRRREVGGIRLLILAPVMDVGLVAVVIELLGVGHARVDDRVHVEILGVVATHIARRLERVAAKGTVVLGRRAVGVQPALHIVRHPAAHLGRERASQRLAGAQQRRRDRPFREGVRQLLERPGEALTRAARLVADVTPRRALHSGARGAALLEQLGQVVRLEQLRLRAAADAHDARLELQDALEELVERMVGLAKDENRRHVEGAAVEGAGLLLGRRVVALGLTHAREVGELATVDSAPADAPTSRAAELEASLCEALRRPIRRHLRGHLLLCQLALRRLLGGGGLACEVTARAVARIRRLEGALLARLLLEPLRVVLVLRRPRKLVEVGKWIGSRRRATAGRAATLIGREVTVGKPVESVVRLALRVRTAIVLWDLPALSRERHVLVVVLLLLLLTALALALLPLPLALLVVLLRLALGTALLAHLVALMLRKRRLGLLRHLVRRRVTPSGGNGAAGATAVRRPLAAALSAALSAARPTPLPADDGGQPALGGRRRGPQRRVAQEGTHDQQAHKGLAGAGRTLHQP